MKLYTRKEFWIRSRLIRLNILKQIVSDIHHPGVILETLPLDHEEILQITDKTSKVKETIIVRLGSLCYQKVSS